MLTHIHIKNYAIIEHWEVDFQNQLTVVTGESGAGKSILIDAVELGLGGRVDASVIRAGEERAEIVLTLDVKNNNSALEWLKEKDYNSESECIIRRVINANGRTKISINGTPCTLQEIKALASLLFNIHGQHQNQSLLQKKYQLEILDNFASHQNLKNNVANVVSQWQETKTQLQKLKNNSDNFEAQVELLQYQVNELDALELQENEYDQLDEEQRQLANAEHYLTTCHRALNGLNNDDDGGIINQLHTVYSELLSMHSDNESIRNTLEMINNAIIQVDEANNELSHFVDRFNADPEKLNTVEQRLSRIHEYARKHKVEPKKLFEKYLALQNELDVYLNASSNINELEKILAALQNDFTVAAKKLTESRKKFSKKFCQLVSEKMQLLGMSGGRFEIQFQNNKDNLPHHHGAETIEFFVSANPGQPIGSLNKVASGGEISRIALAIQVIATQKMITPTMIFDEVDVGIGGNTAAVVGNILRQLGEKAQVICITHQPQVAVCGHHHLHVQKTTEKNSTTTSISSLTAKEKTNEIARMLGGMKITDKTLANAKDLIANAITK